MNEYILYFNSAVNLCDSVFVLCLCYKKKLKVLQIWQITFTVSYILLKWNYIYLTIFFIQPMLFSVVNQLKLGVIPLWFISGFVLAILNYFKSIINEPEFYKEYNLKDFEIYLLISSLFWLNLKCLSFCLEAGHSSKTCLDVFAYCLYPSTVLTGPFILYKNFQENYNSSVLNLTKCKKFFRNIFRTMLWYLCTYICLHFIYVSAAAYHKQLFENFNGWSLYGFGYTMGQFFHLKYVILYGMSTNCAAFENIDVPNLPRCIGRIHLYSDMWKYFDVGLYKFLLRYLASGCSMGELHYSYKIGRSTVAGIIHEVCKVLWRELKTVVMEIPTADKWREIANGFEKHAKFPNCIGAIDGKHIRLFQPAQSASLYYNYKHFFSLLLLALCDANYCFTWVDIGAYGKNSDSGVFQESTLYRMLMEKTLNIPEPTAITGGSIVPYVIVGDEAFALMENLMKPFGGKLLTYEKKIFNYRLTLARRYIECTFGIMCNKWRILHRPLDVNINFAEDIVKAICVLHNYVRQRDGSTFEETLYTAPLTNLQQSSTRRTGRVTENVRNKFMHYFVNEGKVDWQNSMI
ncbi:uncharacterized protein rasp isoform X2 [Diabrotica undecimpunctata]|uniref:uncharacterized protein rasp isoform X2 n=1 Tax=Diabrotica undecimpunctata TaxID=50387 RepID=UPI003B63E580